MGETTILYRKVFEIKGDDRGILSKNADEIIKHQRRSIRKALGVRDGQPFTLPQDFLQAFPRHIPDPNVSRLTAGIIMKMYKMVIDAEGEEDTRESRAFDKSFFTPVSSREQVVEELKNFVNTFKTARADLVGTENYQTSSVILLTDAMLVLDQTHV